jgi:hypothetical protein
MQHKRPPVGHRAASLFDFYRPVWQPPPRAPTRAGATKRLYGPSIEDWSQLIDWPIWLARRLSAAAASGLGSVPEPLGSGQADASNFNHRATNMFISGTTRSREWTRWQRPGPDDDSEADDTHDTAAIPAHPATFAHRFSLNWFVPVARIVSGSSGSSSVRCSSGDIGWAVEENRQLLRRG